MTICARLLVFVLGCPETKSDPGELGSAFLDLIRWRPFSYSMSYLKVPISSISCGYRHPNIRKILNSLEERKFERRYDGAENYSCCLPASQEFKLFLFLFT